MPTAFLQNFFAPGTAPESIKYSFYINNSNTPSQNGTLVAGTGSINTNTNNQVQLNASNSSAGVNSTGGNRLIIQRTGSVPTSNPTLFDSDQIFRIVALPLPGQSNTSNVFDNAYISITQQGVVVFSYDNNSTTVQVTTRSITINNTNQGGTASQPLNVVAVASNVNGATFNSETLIIPPGTTTSSTQGILYGVPRNTLLASISPTPFIQVKFSNNLGGVTTPTQTANLDANTGWAMTTTLVDNALQISTPLPLENSSRPPPFTLTKSSTSSWAIILGIIGGVILLIIVIIAVVIYLRNQNKTTVYKTRKTVHYDYV